LLRIYTIDISPITVNTGDTGIPPLGSCSGSVRVMMVVLSPAKRLYVPASSILIVKDTVSVASFSTVTVSLSVNSSFIYSSTVSFPCLSPVLFSVMVIVMGSPASAVVGDAVILP
jgi:hypothetical protein